MVVVYIVIYLFGGVAGVVFYPFARAVTQFSSLVTRSIYEETPRKDLYEGIYGIEFVFAFLLWWIVLPIALLLIAVMLFKALIEWLFAKS